MHQEEKLLPKELAARAVKQGDVWCWKFKDVPVVVRTCRELNLTIFAGSIVAVLPKGIIDIYWVGAYPKVKIAGESWIKYVERSCSEFIDLFNVLTANVNLEKELESLKAKPEYKNISLDDFYFEIDFKSEASYLESISKYFK